MQLAVFVVEDNAEIQENLVDALEELTCVKVVGGSATEDGAMAWVAQHPIDWDMLIVDLFLKGGSGIRLVQRVQRARAEQKLIVFSNYVNASVRKRCAQLGVDAVFDKSTEIDALVDYCSHQCTLLGTHAANLTPDQNGDHMSNAVEFPSLTLVEREDPPPSAAQPATPAASSPTIGRRWSDGAGSFGPVDPNAPWSMSHQWPNLVAALSEQAVESSNLLLRALNYLVGAGRLRRSEAKALSDAMHQLRGTSLRAQQITRLAGGRIRQARERVDLAELVRHVLEERSSEITAAGATVTSDLQAVDVLLDPPVAISLLNAILDWGLSFSKEVKLTLVPSDWPGPAQLKVRVKTPPPLGGAHPGGVGWTVRPRGRRLNDGLHWMMLRQIAVSSSLEVTRSRENGAALLTINFPKTFLNTEGMACVELTGHDNQSTPLSETWVLVLVRDDKLRMEAVDALRKMGIEAVAAADPASARIAIGETRPNVLVTAYDISPAEIATFRQDVLGGEERCPLVEITRELPSFHLSGFDRFETPKVGREQVTAELPPTVLFELVKIV